jgi:transposase
MLLDLMQPPDPYFKGMGVFMEERNTRYVGIDVGKTTIVVRLLQDNGTKVISWSGKTDAKGREHLAKMLVKTDVVGIEAGEPGFTIAREIIERVGAKVLVLNPGRLAMIYKSLKKTDAEDALKLARLVMRFPECELPVVSIPDDEEREKRALVSEDDFLKVTRTRMILRLHSIYVRAGITHLKRKNLKTAEMRQEALKLLSGELEKYGAEAERIERLILAVEVEIETVEASMKEKLQESELAPVLMTVPGVGPSLALAFLAHIGDGSRFQTVGQVNNYVGFVPRIDFSGQTERSGHITKRGCKHIRRIAVQAAWALVRSKEGGALKEKYRDLRIRRGKKIAIVAIARKLIETLWTLAVRKKPYQYSTPASVKFKYRKYGLKFTGSVA